MTTSREARTLAPITVRRHSEIFEAEGLSGTALALTSGSAGS